MLAFTIQFPNNNPTPPQTHPNNNPTKRDHHHQACPQQTQDKHRNTKNPSPQPTTTTNPSTHQTAHQKTSKPVISQTRRLVASKPNSMPNHTNHTPSTLTFQHPHQQPPKESPAKMRTNKHQHHTAIANTPHTPHNPHKADQIACMLSGTEFIDIPPMSNPPKQHSCLA